MRRLCLAGLVLVCGITGSTAADGDAMTLQQAVDTALANNHQVAAAEAGVRRAEADVDTAKSALRPRVDFHEVVSRTTNPVMVFGNLLRQESFGPENFDVGFLNEPDALTNFGSMLTVRQPIWTGGKVGNSVDAAESGAAAAASGRDRTRQEVVHQVIAGYTGTVLAERQLEVARAALETARAHVALVQDLFEGGLVVESDLLQAQVRESEIEEMVARAEAGLATARAGLNMVLGLPLGQPLTLDPEIALDPESRADDLDRLILEALEQRPDLAAAQARVNAAQAMVSGARSGARPEIGVQGSYEANDESFLGTDGTNWTVMVAATVPVFDGFETRSKVRRARAELDVAREQQALLGQSVELEVRRAWHDLRAATRRLVEATRSVELARTSLRIVEDRYKEGLTTMVELLDAETALTRARTRRVAAQRDVFLSRATLDLAVGRL